MSELSLGVLPSAQKRILKLLSSENERLAKSGFYLAGGTALALQLGHRRSVDFDFFSQEKAQTEKVLKWLQYFPHFLIRSSDADTLHAQAMGVKLSFLSHYRYKLGKPVLNEQGIRLASIEDIGAMKLLAITHRATARDYIDLAAIISKRISLSDLLSFGKKKFGARFNPLISLRAAVAFEDVDMDLPLVFDKELRRGWKKILENEVRRVARR